MGRDPLRTCKRLAAEQGDVALFRLGRRRIALVSHPELIHRVFVAGVRDFLRPEATSSPAGFLRSADFDRHLQARRALNEAFSRARVEAASDQMAAIAERGSKRWQDGQTIDVLGEMMRLTVEIFFRAMIAADPPRSLEEVVEQFRLCLHTVQPAQSGVYAQLARLRLGKVVRASAAFSSLLGLMDELVAQKRDEGTDGPDPISILIRTVPDLEREELAAEVFSLVFAASETTAATLTWMLLLLARHRDVCERVREETARETAGTLPPQMRGAMSETLRLYPVAWQLEREARADTRLDGHELRRGTRVWAVPYLVHRDERWWPEPDRFLPERWLEPDRSPDRPRLAYIPFGAGPRRCLGEALAWQEIAAIVAAVLRRWELTPEPGEIRLHAGSTLYPAGLRMRVAKRL